MFGTFSTWTFRKVNSKEDFKMLKRSQEAKAGVGMLRNMETCSASDINKVRQAEPLLNGWECSSVILKPLLDKFKFSLQALPKELHFVPEWPIPTHRGGLESICVKNSAVQGTILFISVCSLEASSSLPSSFPSSSFSVKLFS